MDLVSVAAGNSGRARDCVWDRYGPQRHALNESIVVKVEPFATAHAPAGGNVLECGCGRRLWHLSSFDFRLDGSLMATALGETKTMQISGLEFLFLEVNNLEESVAFYRDSLGFAVSKHSPESEPPLATVQAGNLKISLAQHLETMLKRGRGVSFFIGVSDVDDYYKQLRAKDVEVYPPADEGWGGRFITLQDPDKYRLFFVTWGDDRRDR